MKEMKKILTVFICLFFALVLMLAGCSKNGKPIGNAAASGADGTADPESLYSAPGVLPIVNKPVTLSIFAPAASEIPRAESDMTKWMEEITGIHVEWQTAASDAYREKMQLLLASGDYPDMIVPGVSYRIDKTVEQQLGMQGIIIPLTEFYDTISIGYKDAFGKLPGMREYMTAQDGNIYSMPNVDGALQMQYQNKLWVNTVWLRAVGKNMPTTLDEFYDVLKAFKEQDANGNGDPNDEIPFSAAGSSVLDVFLMNPFILTPATDRMWVNNGKIVFSVTDPAYKEGVRYLAKLYAEGLMNPELFTWNATTQVNTNENGDVPVLGSVLGQRPGNFCSLSGYPEHSRKWEQYYPAAPFKMVNGGETIINWNAYAATFQTGVAMITNACKYPEAAFRMVDLLATPEMTIITTNGPKGQGWREAVEGEVGLNGAPAKYTVISADRPKNWGGWDQLMGRVQTSEYLASLTYNPDPYAPEVDPMQGRHVVLYRSSLEYQKVSQSLESVLPPLYFSDTVMDEYSLLKTNINTYVEEMLVAFVTGAKNADRDWGSYMQQLNTLGLVRYLQIVQETYDASAFTK